MCSKQSDHAVNHDSDVPQKSSYLTGTGRNAGNLVFKSAYCVDRTGVDDIDSYSSEGDDGVADHTPTTTGGSIIDYKNQFPTNPVGKVSKELLTGDNDAFILARKKKWMNAKKGKTTGKTRQKRWKKFKAKKGK